jgi:nucleoside-diphosphate-sugar epimerase
MIFYNGATGGLGRYLGDAAEAARAESYALKSRLEDSAGMSSEFGAFHGKSASFVMLGAKASVPWCDAHAEEAYRTNVTNTLESARVFIEACAFRKTKPRLVYVSTAHVYARNEGPIFETNPVLPRSVYAKTKLEAENALRVLADQSKIDLRIARIFGLVAPVQAENYILPAMVKRAREKRVKEVPGLSNLRDYLDARDVCRSLVFLATIDADRFVGTAPDRILNIASGKGRTIRSILELALGSLYPEAEAMRLSEEITEAPARADDVPSIVASVARIRALLGENPSRISLTETLRDAGLSYERKLNS